MLRRVLISTRKIQTGSILQFVNCFNHPIQYPLLFRYLSSNSQSVTADSLDVTLSLKNARDKTRRISTTTKSIELAKEEAFAIIENWSSSHSSFVSALKSLANLKITRNNIPIEVIKIIGERFIGVQPNHLTNVDIIHALGTIGIYHTDFDASTVANMLLTVEEALKTKPTLIFNVLNGLSHMRFTVKQMSSSLVTLIDNALKENIGEYSRIENALMQYMDFYWSILSVDTKNNLQNNLNLSLPNMTPRRFDTMLRHLTQLRVTIKDLNIARATLIQSINLRLTTVKPDEAHGFFIGLSYLNCSWNSLTIDARTSLLNAINQTLSEKNHSEISKILVGFHIMGATYNDLDSINIVLMEALKKVGAKCDSMEMKNDIYNLAAMGFPYSSLHSLHNKIEKLIIIYLQQNNATAFYIMKHMDMKYDSMTPMLKEYLSSNICKYLSKLEEEHFAKAFKSLCDLKIFWNSFTPLCQQQIIILLTRNLKLLNEKDYYFAMSSFIKMHPNYLILPELLQKEIMRALVNILTRNKTSNGLSSAIDSLGKMNLKYVHLSEEVKDCLQQSIINIKFLDEVSIYLVLKGLTNMEMKSTDCTLELKHKFESLVIKNESHKERFRDWLQSS